MDLNIEMNSEEESAAEAVGARNDSPVELETTVAQICLACNARMGRPLHGADLDDVIQEVVISHWKKLATFEGRSTEVSWIYGIARLAILHKRRGNRRREARLASYSSADLASIEAPRAVRAEAETGLRRAVKECLDLAGSTVALIVNERSVLGRSFREIGERLGRPEVAIKARYYRALPRLRERLSRVWRSSYD